SLSGREPIRRCPSSATADNLATSNTLPIAMTGQNEPRKMLVSPTMLKNTCEAERAEQRQPASDAGATACRGHCWRNGRRCGDCRCNGVLGLPAPLPVSSAPCRGCFVLRFRNDSELSNSIFDCGQVCGPHSIPRVNYRGDAE